MGGRAYEYAARIRDFHKELKQSLQRYSIKNNKPIESSDTYLLVGEFAYRYASCQNSPQVKKVLEKFTKFPGKYSPRVNGAIQLKSGHWIQAK